jgi:hypothetical protein
LFEPTLQVISFLEGDQYPSQSLIVALFSVLREQCSTEMKKLNQVIQKAIDQPIQPMSQHQSSQEISTSQGLSRRQKQSQNKEKSESSFSESSDIEALQFLAETDRILYQVLEKWQTVLEDIWHNSLPQETLIAAALDPRFKSLSFLPEEESNEAFESIAKEVSNCELLLPEQLSVQINSKVCETGILKFFNPLPPKNLHHLEEEDELQMYTKMKQPTITTDPLQWWKSHQTTFPVLSEIAKKFLAIPASQATTERAFSTSGNIITKRRSRLSSVILEALVLFHKNEEFFEFLSTDSELVKEPPIKI